MDSHIGHGAPSGVFALNEPTVRRGAFVQPDGVSFDLKNVA